MGQKSYSYIHGGVDFCHRFIISGELVNLDPVADQFTGDFDFKLGQFTFGDGIRFGDDGDDVDLKMENKGLKNMTPVVKLNLASLKAILSPPQRASALLLQSKFRAALMYFCKVYAGI